MDLDFLEDQKPNITEHISSNFHHQGHWAGPGHDPASQAQTKSGGSGVLKHTSSNRFFSKSSALPEIAGGSLRSRISSHHSGDQAWTSRLVSQGFQANTLAGASISVPYNTGRVDKHVLKDMTLNSAHISLNSTSHGAAARSQTRKSVFSQFPKPAQSGSQARGLTETDVLESKSASLGGLDMHRRAVDTGRHGPIAHPPASPSFQDHQRSPSKASPVMKVEEFGDNLSALASKLSDMKKYISEAEELRELNAELRVQLSKLEEDYKRRLDATKIAAKSAAEASRRSLEEMHATLEGLRIQGQASFGFAAEIRSNLPAAEEIRATIQQSIERFESLFDHEGRLVQRADMKDVVVKLQVECTKTRQANDLLHDKLTDLASQLVEAKDRVRDLESLHLNNTTVLRSSHDQITDANRTIVKQGDALKSAHQELVIALSAHGDAQAKLEILEGKYARLQESVVENDNNAVILQELRNENIRLQTLLEQKSDLIESLSSVKQELVVSTTISVQQQAELETLKTTLRDKGQLIEQLRDQYEKIATRESISQQLIAKYESDVEAIRASEKAAIEAKGQILSMKSASDERGVTLERELKAAIEEAGHHKEKAQQVTTQLQLLQQRFEDQSTTLQLTKEANCEAQERMIATEKASAAKLDREIGTFQHKIHVVDERNSTLTQALEDSKREVQRLKDHVNSMQAAHDKRLEAERDSGQSIVLDTQKRILQTEEQRNHAKREAEDLRQQLLTARHEFELFKERSERATISSTLHVTELDALKQQLQALQTERDQLVARTQTIDTRYKNGQLSDAEAEFVDAILKESASLYEQKLADKQNQLRRKANVNEELSAKVVKLEKALARHLNTEALNKASASAVQSIVNLDNFMSSEVSMPMSQAPDSDGSNGQESPLGEVHASLPSKAGIYHVVTGAATERLQTAASPQGQVTTSAVHQAAEDNIQPRTPKRLAGRGLFRRLISEASDDIIEFEDQELDAASSIANHKRDRQPSPSKVEDVAQTSRPGKRPRTSTQRANGRKSEGRQAVTKKVPDQTSKLRSRRER